MVASENNFVLFCSDKSENSIQHGIVWKLSHSHNGMKFTNYN